MPLLEAPASPVAASGSATVVAPPGFGYRWLVCALVFLATTINYIDRQVLGILAPTLQAEIGWTESEYGDIVFAFQLAYALALVAFGHLADRLGTRRSYAVAIIGWSLAAMAHALARTPLGFAVARFALGLGEAGNFPTAIKTMAEWFPRRERALATGIFNGGTNIGAIVAPLVVPWITLTWGWRWAFLVTGALGFLWVAAWLALYRTPERHPRVSSAELAYIRQDPPEPTDRIAWRRLLPHRQTWAFAAGKFMADPIWWFYLFWLPKYLDGGFGVRLTALAAPLVVVYLVSDVGSIAGGWLSSALLRRGWSVNRARKTAMLGCALCVTPLAAGAFVDLSMWTAVGLVALAAAAHQGWSANVYTMASDLFPKRAVGSVVGIGGMAGAVGGMLFALAAGRWLEYSHGNYVPLFLLSSMAYVSAWLVVHALSPRLEPARID